MLFVHIREFLHTIHNTNTDGFHSYTLPLLTRITLGLQIIYAKQDLEIGQTV